MTALLNLIPVYLDQSLRYGYEIDQQFLYHNYGYHYFWQRVIRKYLALDQNVAVHKLFYEIFIDIFKFHDVEFFIQGFSTAVKLDIQKDTQNFILKNN